MLQLGTFCVDLTPPVGFATGFGTGDVTEAIRDPLLLRGFLLDDGSERCLVASLDYCGLMNSAYDELCAALAEAVETTPDHIAVHCIHQHDAPLLNFEIEACLGCVTFPREWWQKMIASCNVTAGKFTSPTELEGNLTKFGKRLADGILTNLRGTITGDDTELAWTRGSFPFPRADLNKNALLESIADTTVPAHKRLLQAVLLSSFRLPGEVVSARTTAVAGQVRPFPLGKAQPAGVGGASIFTSAYCLASAGRRARLCRRALAGLVVNGAPSAYSVCGSAVGHW